VKSVRRSFSGHCGVRTIAGIVVDGRDVAAAVVAAGGCAAGVAPPTLKSRNAVAINRRAGWVIINRPV
jgi:hypothetical protein